MRQRSELTIAGGGPAGSAAPWRATQPRSRVLVVAKADTPRDKPCGDRLTPGAASLIDQMGLRAEVATLHRVNPATVLRPSERDMAFARRPSVPVDASFPASAADAPRKRPGAIAHMSDG